MTAIALQYPMDTNNCERYGLLLNYVTLSIWMLGGDRLGDYPVGRLPYGVLHRVADRQGQEQPVLVRSSGAVIDIIVDHHAPAGLPVLAPQG